MKRILVALPLIAMALMAFTAPFGGSAAAADGDLTVKAGAGEPGYAINQFLPNTVTVVAGSTVTWDWSWAEPHSVTFGAPGAPAKSPATFEGGALNTDLIFGPGQKFDVKFTKKGSFEYYCLIHPEMTAKVHVIDKGGPGEPDTQLSADSRARAEQSSSDIALKELARVLAASPVAITRLPNGSSQYTLAVGGVTTDGGDVQQFFPARANIKVGDSIKWVNKSPTPHTVTFNAPVGPPDGDVTLLPEIKPGASFDGTGVWSSGTIWTIPAPGTRTTFEMTFSKAGSYKYVCLLHEVFTAPQAMFGTVNVEAQTAPLPPNTGTGTSSTSSTGTLWFALFGLAAIALGGSTIAVARRRS
jgi:plastocyanin